MQMAVQCAVGLTVKHKYGFCPKGTSVIMYHSPELRRYQYYIMTDWAGGVYASPSMAGSRAGSVLAGAWAAINYIGQESVSFHTPPPPPYAIPVFLSRSGTLPVATYYHMCREVEAVRD
jgi:hypothetical protein